MLVCVFLPFRVTLFDRLLFGFFFAQLYGRWIGFAGSRVFVGWFGWVLIGQTSNSL
jgi:hypothetical protein